MAKGYRPVERDQLFLLPPDMREWVPGDHPVHVVIEAVGCLDTGVLHGGRRAGGAGAAGYDPEMLLCVLVWGYACGVTSSRRLEELCWRDASFRLACGGPAPDHVTIARFRQGLAEVIGELFGQVLVLCARLGMGQLGVVALDGTKVRANASLGSNRGEERLRELAGEAVARHGAADAAEDALFGEGRRGDRVPGGRGGSAGGSLRERVGRALAGIEDDRREAEREREELARRHAGAADAGAPVRGRYPAGSEAELARRRAERAGAAQEAKVRDWERRAAERAAAGRRPPPGNRPRPPDECARVLAARASADRAAARGQARAEKEKEKRPRGPVRSITDPDSRIMRTASGGFIQGYNAQNLTTADGLIIATALTSDANDVSWFEPLIEAASQAAVLITRHQPRKPGSQDEAGHGEDGRRRPIGLVLADAGYLSEHNLTVPGPDRLIATRKHRDLEKAARTPQPPEPPEPPGSSPPGPVAAMTARLRTPAGITACRQRGHIAETPHATIKHTMGIRQLTQRGDTAATAEWDFITLVHNILKAITSGRATRQSLAALRT